MSKSQSKTVRIRLVDLDDLERARANLAKAVPGVADLNDAVVVGAGIGALNEKLESKLVPVEHAHRMAATLANDLAASAIVTVIKSFFEDLHPNADAVHVEYQPITGLLRVVIDDGEPLLFAPEPEGVTTDDERMETIQ